MTSCGHSLDSYALVGTLPSRSSGLIISMYSIKGTSAGSFHIGHIIPARYIEIEILLGTPTNNSSPHLTGEEACKNYIFCLVRKRPEAGKRAWAACSNTATLRDGVFSPEFLSRGDVGAVRPQLD